MVLGRIIAPYGVKGWLKLLPMGDDHEAWRRMPTWWLSMDPAGADWQPYALESLRMHGKGLVAKLAGVDDRNAAEALDGCYFGAPREALPATDKDEFYWGDLIGLRVVNAQGQYLGCVTGLLETGANAVLVVREGVDAAQKERLLPFIAQVVKDVDVAAGRIRVEWESDW